MDRFHKFQQFSLDRYITKEILGGRKTCKWADHGVGIDCSGGSCGVVRTGGNAGACITCSVNDDVSCRPDRQAPHTNPTNERRRRGGYYTS